MTTNYPQGLDQIPFGDEGVALGDDHLNAHRTLSAAVRAIQTTVGLNPSRTLTQVAGAPAAQRPVASGMTLARQGLYAGESGVSWGTSLTINSPPAGGLMALASLTGFTESGWNGNAVTTTYLQIAFDGAYTSGPPTKVLTANVLDSKAIGAQWWRSGTPSTSVTVRAVLGTANGNAYFDGGALTLLLLPTAN